nr:zinc-ribbon domain-containing protein [Paracoccus saliphilus]
MAEIRLICPGCDAEYVVPQEAIPPAGREVECSACAHVWRAQRPPKAAAPLDLGSYTLPRPVEGGNDEDERTVALPPARRRLSPDVLDILREEVDHERRLRETEAATPPADPPAPHTGESASSDDPSLRDTPSPEDDSLWPATTVILPAGATRAITTNPQPQAPTAAAVAAAPLRPATPTDGTAVLSLRPAPVQQVRPVPPAATRPAPSPAPSRKGYGLGFGLAVLAAAILLALYLLAPRLQDGGGPLAGPLNEWRQDVDRARHWLGQLISGLRD